MTEYRRPEAKGYYNEDPAHDEFPLSSWGLEFCEGLAEGSAVQRFFLFTAQHSPVTSLLFSESLRESFVEGFVYIDN